MRIPVQLDDVGLECRERGTNAGVINRSQGRGLDVFCAGQELLLVAAKEVGGPFDLHFHVRVEIRLETNPGAKENLKRYARLGGQAAIEVHEMLDRV